MLAYKAVEYADDTPSSSLGAGDGIARRGTRPLNLVPEQHVRNLVGSDLRHGKSEAFDANLPSS